MTDIRPCSQMTAKGTPCKLPAYANTDRCHQHLNLKVGRPTKLTDEMADQLIAMLRVGNYIYVSTQACGISRERFDLWMRRGATGEPEDEHFAKFRERVDKARAEGQVRHVATVSRAADTDWRAATWLLERQYPQLWGAVSVRVRADEPQAAQPMPTAPDDPFAEVDELAERRAGRPA